MKKEHILKDLAEWLETIPTDARGVNIDIIDGARFSVQIYVEGSPQENTDEEEA